MHQRKLIRDKIRDLLKGATSAGDKVFASRVSAIDEAKLPCLLVYANSEKVEIYVESPRQYQRDLTISIEIIAKADSGLDDTLDSIASDVEDKLMQDYTLGDLAADIILSGTELTIRENGNVPIGSCVLTYQVPWYSLAVSDRSEENHYNDLDTIDIKYQMPAATGVDPTGHMDAEDVVDLT